MKWFKNTAYATIEALDKIFNKGYQADKVIQKLLKSNKKWGSRDRKLISKALYDIIRWKRKYEYLTNTDILSPEGKWKILALWSLDNNIEIPEWFEVDNEYLKKEISKKITSFPIKESIPDWLYKKGIDEMGKNAFENVIEALNHEAKTVIRVNPLKVTKNKLKQILKEKGIDFYELPSYPDALIIKGKPKLTHLDAFKNGYFEIQDASSQRVAEFAEPRPGQLVIDACAGAGGKTLHMASKMQNKGEIIAMDIYPHKLKELKKRAHRNGVKIIKETPLISTKVLKKYKEKADVLLLDVPCSSLGTLKRKPGLKWELSEEKIERIKTLQKNILEQYTDMLKPGGTLIYVTCSILPSENKQQVNNFLNKHKNFTFVEDKSILPSENEFDGFYMAKLKKVK